MGDGDRDLKRKPWLGISKRFEKTGITDEQSSEQDKRDLVHRRFPFFKKKEEKELRVCFVDL